MIIIKIIILIIIDKIIQIIAIQKHVSDAVQQSTCILQVTAVVCVGFASAQLERPNRTLSPYV